MGQRFLRSIVQDVTTISATGEIAPVDLPTNPLSFLILTLFGEQPAALVTNAYRHLTDFLAAVTDLRVAHKGENIVQGDLGDLTMLTALLTGYRPTGRENNGAAANRAMSFVIPFGRVLWGHNEAFPATSRGHLRFHMNVADVSPGTFTALQFALEAVELIEDDPSHYLKYTTNTRAMTATGRQRTPLPLGNSIVGVLLFDPTTEVDGTETYAWGKVKLMKDNVEQYYAETNWESLAVEVGARLHSAQVAFDHRHGQAAADTDTGGPQLKTHELPLGYGYLDFDPLRDGSYLLDTAGASDVELDTNSDVSTGTVRYLPVELVAARR